MDPSSLPVWAQSAGVIAIAIVSAIIGVLKYLKTDDKPAAESSTGAVLSASFLDSKLLKELIEALREHQDEAGRDSKKTHRALQDLKEALLENTEQVIINTDSMANLLKFVSRNTTRNERLIDVQH